MRSPATPRQLLQPRWYVAQTQHRAEARAAHELVNQGFGVFLPLYLKQRRHARKTTRVAAALFPSYLFVAIDPARQRWQAINGTLGVIRLVAHEAGPSPVAEGVVEGLKARANPSGFIELAQGRRFAPGETLRIRSGSFAERLCLFEDFRDQDRVAVLLDLLGSKVRVLLDEALVEKAA